MKQRFFFATMQNKIPYSVECQHHSTRSEFERMLRNANASPTNVRYGYSFREISASCVKRLFGSSDWKHFTAKLWPSGRKFVL